MSLTSREAMPRTVVVGYDGSDEARAAFALALDRCGPADTIAVVHAMAPASSWLGAPYYQRVVTRIIDTAERLFDELRPFVEQVETRIEFAALEGRPAEILIRAADVRDADEIVVGCRGLGRIRGALGSVSQELLRDAARPVVVVSRDAAALVEDRGWTSLLRTA